MGLNRVCAQTHTSVGLLPSINYNHKIKRDWDVNFKYESRHFMFQNNPIQQDKLEYDYLLSDFSVLVGRKAGLNSKVTLGVLTRIEPGAMAYRTIQQYIHKAKISTYRVTHRIAADQTFSSHESAEFRLRYRLSAEVPLSGKKVDLKEFYIKLNTETLNSIQNDTYDLEFRVVPNIGYVINKHHKVEFGLDNRFDSFINDQFRFTSWVALNWYYK
ncbi:DUF2490 domain-containing protein [Fulvivirgaceae bacterium BMA12]|uniref:DUF2490 domain-containing protein n=1 Tax=Agaribacillus aureus TaxID=3051825 RepID=A0ABT8LBH9_9BACT|nr:DUF2490 domain-containing protein [Fulvivirgaceae bacterium BMA12]